MSTRLERLREKLAGQKLDGLIVSDVADQVYLAGTAGQESFDSILLVSTDDARIATDSRYWEVAEREARGFSLVKIKMPEYDYAQALRDFAEQQRLHTVGFDAMHLTYERFRKMQKAARKGHFKLKPTDRLVKWLRAVKDEAEIAKIRRAVELADRAFAHFCEQAHPGMTEKQGAWLIETFIRTHGGDALAFDSIVASGPNAALPHAEPTDRAFQAGEPITVDIGARVDRYNSDLTRTICLGEPDDKFKEIYNVVLKAQQAVEKKTRAGTRGRQADAWARRVIEKAGHGEHFGHGTGHGVGLAVHELPRAGRKAKDVLEPNMTLTVEPGIYVPGWGGVRIEDLVVIRPDGVEVLSQATKDPVVKWME